MDIEFNGQMTAILGFVLVLVVIGIILFLRNQFKSSGNSDLTEKYRDKEWGSVLKARNKYPDVNAFGMSGSFLRFGLAAALALVLLGFSWTTYEDDVFIPDDALELDEEIEIEPPRTAEPPPPPPPPPPPVIEEVPEEEILEEEEPEFVDQDVEEETVIEDAPVAVEEAPPPPPPPPPPPEPEVEEIFKVVEQMPRFPGCENEAGDNKAKEECAKKKMLQYIYKNLNYPAIARENGVEGSCVIQFVVDKDGSVTEANLVRDIGAGCGSAALKVVKDMNNLPQKWTPGKQRGRNVKVLYTLPVRFKLEG